MQKLSLLERWFPHPFVSVLIFLSWLMLAHSLDLTDILMALILAVAIARLPHIHWLPAIKLVFVVLWDIVISNFRVAKMVLGPMDQLHPKWYRVPLETWTTLTV